MLALPLTYTLFKYLPDKGYAFSKIFALLIVGYFTWLAGYVTAFSARTVYVAILILGAASYLLLARTWVPLSEFIQTNKKYMISEACISRGVSDGRRLQDGTFEINGTEKPMDFAFINAILASPQMPPQDPWLAGGHISYYYGGYFIVASLAKLQDILRRKPQPRRGADLGADGRRRIRAWLRADAQIYLRGFSGHIFDGTG
ncbi:MAG: DUF2298 domain-containing protein [Pyrinomonadaceae bacterium]